VLRAGAIKTIKTELSGKHLQGQGGTAKLLCQTLLEYSFCLFDLNGESIPLSLCERYDSDIENHRDIIARHNSTTKCIGKFKPDNLYLL
jgi:hypothetical protein